MTANEIERPLREEIAEIKEMLESMKKDIAAIKDNVDVDISEEPGRYDPEPWIPTQGASLEMVDKAIEEHRKWEERQNNFSICGGHVK